MVRLKDRIGKYIGDLVYGANDGIITTFAVVSAVAGASLQPLIVLIIGFANLIADGFSMAAGNYLASKSKMEYDSSIGNKVDSHVSPMSKGAATFIAFVIAGFMPLIPYAFSLHPLFELSTLITGLTLFVVGSSRSFVTEKGWLKSGLEMLLVGTLAASVAYIIGWLLKGLG